MQSESIKELSTALSKAQGEFYHAKKDVNNTFFKSKYADLASVIDAAKKPLSDNGLAVIQITDFTENGDTYLITTLSHSSGEWISGRYPIKPVKADPQGMGSAITYARRYAFSAITGIAADDDDGNAASGNAGEHSNEKPWFNDFDKLKDRMVADIKAGKTPDAIIKSLSEKYKVSTKVVEQIKALEAA
jgi:hypothetical protein